MEADYVGAGWAKNAAHNAMPNATETTRDAESTIQLAQFLKLQGLVGTGGEAKVLIQRGDVRVNGAIETRRGRRLRPGDQVELAGSMRVVPSDSGES
jgi:ribosome-associated protein